MSHLMRMLRNGMLAGLILVPGAAGAHGSITEGIERLGAAIRAKPHEAGLYVDRANLYRQHSEWEAALADLESARALDPERDALDFYRGRVLLEAGRPAEAEAALARYLAKAPNQPAASAARARALMAMGRPLDAARAFTQAIAHQPVPLPEYYLERAAALASAGPTHRDAALRGLDEGLAKLGSVVTLEFSALELELAAGRFDAALARLDRIAAQSPRQESWLARRSQILEQAGRAEEARAARARARLELEKLPPQRRRTPAMLRLAEQLAEVPASHTRSAGAASEAESTGGDDAH